MRRARAEGQVLDVDRVVTQNDPVVCKEESASFIKELLILHIAIKQVPAIGDVRPRTRSLGPTGVNHVDSDAAALTRIPGFSQLQSLGFDALPVLVVGGMEDVSEDRHRSFVKGSPRVDGSAVGDTRVCPCTADKLMYQSMLGTSS